MNPNFTARCWIDPAVRLSGRRCLDPGILHRPHLSERLHR